tara:strand:- start:375 stop:1448 length:1074 start_codon:yes stop_codon:yes gene_type:complete
MKDIWKNICLLVVVLILGLVVAEVSVRVFLPTRLLDYKYDEEIGIRYLPDTSYQFISGFDEFSVTNTYNSKGLRGKEFSYEKNEVNRILGLGDSFTFGYGVEDDETYLSLLGENLGEYEIINAGLSGYGPQHILKFLKKEGMKYNPDKVLIALYIGNDIGSQGQELFSIENGVLVDKTLPKASFSLQVRQYLAHKLVLYNYLHLIKFRLDVNAGKVNPYTPEVYPFLLDEETLNNGFSFFQEIMKEMKNYLDNKGVELTVIIIPTKEQVSEEFMESFKEKIKEVYDKPDSVLENLGNLDVLHTRLLLFLEEEGIEHIDLLPVFKKLDEDLYFPIDSHLNVKGHEATAIIVAKHLKVP